MIEQVWATYLASKDLLPDLQWNEGTGPDNPWNEKLYETPRLKVCPRVSSIHKYF